MKGQRAGGDEQESLGPFSSLLDGEEWSILTVDGRLKRLGTDLDRGLLSLDPRLSLTVLGT